MTLNLTREPVEGDNLNRSANLKICFLAGTLGQGGAEKQLFYMARSLKQAGADVRVFCPYRGDFYEPALKAEKIPVIWLGDSSNPALRFVKLAAHLFRFRPHIVQAAHFHLNLYAGILGRLLRAVSLAASRSDLCREISVCRPWGFWGVRSAVTLVANSKNAMNQGISLGLRPENVLVLSNVIDLKEFDHNSLQEAGALGPPGVLPVIAVGTLGRAKRFDRFLRALASTQAEDPRLRGVLVGDGPERACLQALAASLGLNGQCRFLGRRNDVPALLKQASMLVLSSEAEGFPNVLLEAMAARLPIVTTDAGDSAELVKAAEAGFVVPHDDVDSMGGCLKQLARDPELRTRLGSNGRAYAERYHSVDRLGEALLKTYHLVAVRHGTRRALNLLNSRNGLQKYA